ncbi:efflux RND transporter periplasmic adaptor subunit [Mesorhizobium sp. M7A.F.Ca.US.011.01.1.1]|uniref:efflux RND transporter periplasmic adaptor subunit n=1 Tax=Mesorhizobium sp. M7A.F.Ca.US.011.01.1.1 TaxID=2496741 RepID=UPI000FCB170E|nr:efflux RND transporter periplasmic adaptor subunit [Mesorhizobium sp. M7A.F.Ca.US.011.01.1.1]RUX29908.1 efflux RND transporter periplasmic adaptor subunit [Mesorhizobium sp. M7A.F.Ca.US.011.01.1.1]
MANCARLRLSHPSLRALVIGAFAALAFAVPSKPTLAQESPAAFDADCLIEPSARVELGASVSGLVKDVLADRGDAVTAGQIVAELDSGVERASLEVARARAENDHEVLSKRSRLEYLTKKSKRITRLAEVKAASEASRDESDSDLKQAEQELREAELSLRMAQLELRRSEALLEQRMIRSPYNGVVIERALSAGAYLHDQAHVLTILQTDPLFVEAYLPLGRYGRIQIGDLAEVSFPEGPVGGSLTAKVSVVDRFIDAPSATFGVRLTLDNPDGRVPAGVRCTIRFRTRVATQRHDAGLARATGADGKARMLGTGQSFGRRYEID